MFSLAWGVWQELILSGVGNVFLAGKIDFLTTVTRDDMMGSQSCL
jgi:hypothetical protein